MASSEGAFEERRMSIARVFERGFATIKSNPATMFGIAFLFSALPGTLIAYGVEFVQQPMLDDLGAGAMIAIWIATMLLAMIFGMITQAAWCARRSHIAKGARRASASRSWPGWWSCCR
jgi:hypothetical protein